MNWLKLKCQTCLREGCVDQTLDEDEGHGEGEQLPALPILALRSAKTQKIYLQRQNLDKKVAGT